MPRCLFLDIYAQASLPRHLFFDFSFFLLYGHFLWAVKENAPKFLPPKKEPVPPDFHPFCTGSFCLLCSPQRPVLLIVFVLAIRSAFLGAVFALVLLSIFRIILVGLFLCVIVLGHSALLFSPLLFSMKIKMQQIIFVAQERLSIPAAITVSPAFTDTSIGTLQANYTYRFS